MLASLCRWLPNRELAVVADQAYAALYAPPLPGTPGQRDRLQLKGKAPALAVAAAERPKDG